MKFRELLRLTALCSSVSTTVLVLITVVVATLNGSQLTLYIASGWWLIAGLLGLLLGRRKSTFTQLEDLLSEAKRSTAVPLPEPLRVFFNRLWPLLTVSITASIVGVFIPSVAALATGLTVVLSLTWLRQYTVVRSVEERDGLIFYVDRTSPISPIKLVVVPGLKRDR